MTQLSPAPYWLKLPYDLTRLFNALTTLGLLISTLAIGAGIGVVLVNILGATGVGAGALFIIGVAIPWMYMMILDSFRSSRRRYALRTKWCHIPTVDAPSTVKAWIHTQAYKIVIDTPGFYLLKPGCHCVFVGTEEEYRHHLDMVLNGGL